VEISEGEALLSSSEMQIALHPIFLSFFVVAIVGERILNALLSFLWATTVGFAPGERNLFSDSSLQLLAKTSSSAGRVWTALVDTFSTGILALLSWGLFSFALLAISGLLYAAYEEYPSVMRGFLTTWNSSLGPRIHATLTIPADILWSILSLLLPLYNALVWVVTRVGVELLVEPITRDPSALVRIGVSAASAANASAMSIVSFSRSTFSPCLNSTQCSLRAEDRALDLITPLLHVRTMVGHIATFVATSMCSQAAIPLQILVAPLMDTRLAKGVHSLVNSILWTFVQVPIVTEARCRLFSNIDGAIMCIPDFAPTVKFAIEGLRNVGQVLDDWLNLILLVLQQLVDGPVCRGSTSGGSSFAQQQQHSGIFLPGVLDSSVISQNSRGLAPLSHVM